MEPILDALYRNPWGFECIENDWVRVRFAITKPTEAVPALIIVFRIDPDNHVILLHAEESETY